MTSAPGFVGDRIARDLEACHPLFRWSGRWYNHGMTQTRHARGIVRPVQSGGTGFAKVFGFLRDQLLDGQISPGDRLVPERELAAQLGVSRPILREALRSLSMMGVVEIRSRVGTIVRRPDLSVMGDFFAFALSQQGDLIDDVMQARTAIECQAIRLACERATTFDFERMRLALDRIGVTLDDPVAGGAADFEFHAALVRAAKSETLTSLFDAMTALLQRSHRDRRALVEVDPSMKKYLLDDHRRLFEAVVAGDAEKADQHLRKHFSIGDAFRHKAATRSARVKSTA
jgi:GntR family transcriptional repressor for pyruvate dehydrogenase complex